MLCIDISDRKYTTSAPEHVIHSERVAPVIDERAQGELVGLRNKSHMGKSKTSRMEAHACPGSNMLLEYHRTYKLDGATKPMFEEHVCPSSRMLFMNIPQPIALNGAGAPSTEAALTWTTPLRKKFDTMSMK